MEQIRKTPVGVLLLWIIALGLLALAIWQIAEAFLERNPDTKKKWGYRIKYVGTAIAYLAIAWTALVYALGGQSDSSESSETFSAKVLATPGGVLLLGAVGVIVGAIGIAFIVRGLTRAFEKHLALPAGHGEEGHRHVRSRRLRRQGHRHRRHGSPLRRRRGHPRPETAGGLDDALHALAALPFGADHPVDRRRRTRDLRTLLLRPRALRQDVRAARLSA